MIKIMNSNEIIFSIIVIVFGIIIVALIWGWIITFKIPVKLPSEVPFTVGLGMLCSRNQICESNLTCDSSNSVIPGTGYCKKKLGEGCLNLYECAVGATICDGICKS